MRTLGLLLVIILFGGRLEPARAAAGPDAAHAELDFPKPLEDYHDDQMPGLGSETGKSRSRGTFQPDRNDHFLLRNSPHVPDREIHAYRSCLSARV